MIFIYSCYLLLKLIQFTTQRVMHSVTKNKHRSSFLIPVSNPCFFYLFYCADCDLYIYMQQNSHFELRYHLSSASVRITLAAKITSKFNLFKDRSLFLDLEKASSVCQLWWQVFCYTFNNSYLVGLDPHGQPVQ